MKKPSLPAAGITTKVQPTRLPYMHKLELCNRANNERLERQEMASFVLGRVLRRLLARAARQHFTCPFRVLRTQMLAHNTHHSANRMRPTTPTALRTFWMGEDGNPKFQSSTLPYSTTRVLDRRAVFVFRISPHSQRVGFSSHILYAKCALVRNNFTRLW